MPRRLYVLFDVPIKNLLNEMIHYKNKYGNE